MLSFAKSPLFSLFARASAKVDAPINVGELFSGIEIEPPEYTITGGDLSYLEFRRIVFAHKNRDGQCPIRQKFANALVETESEENIPFLQIKGCLSSKSGLTDFEQMKHHPKSSSNVNFHIDSYYDRVEELAEKVLNGTVDCAVSKDRPAEIVRQEWDGNMWLANDGGSYRSAAVWHIDKEQGNERVLNARVKTQAVSQDFQELCKDYSVFLFKSPCMGEIHDIRSKLAEKDILLSKQSDGFMSGGRDYSLIIKKTNPLHNDVANAMKNALNLSGWVNSLYPTVPHVDLNRVSECGLQPV